MAAFSGGLLIGAGFFGAAAGTFSAGIVDALYVPSGLGDGFPPSITNIVPAPGSLGVTNAEARYKPISFDVSDLDNLRLVIITVKYLWRDETLVAFDGTTLLAPFNNVDSSFSAITGGFSFTILPSGGWLDSIELLRVHAIDTIGLVTPP